MVGYPSDSLASCGYLHLAFCGIIVEIFISFYRLLIQVNFEWFRSIEDEYGVIVCMSNAVAYRSYTEHSALCNLVLLF